MRNLVVGSGEPRDAWIEVQRSFLHTVLQLTFLQRKKLISFGNECEKRRQENLMNAPVGERCSFLAYICPHIRKSANKRSFQGNGYMANGKP